MYTSDQIKICVNCADEIANHYHHERSGRYLTWTNPTNKTTHKKVKIPEGIRWEVYERDNFTCRKCGSRRHLSIDHITPESAGGSLSADNLQTLCQTCNKKKGVRGC
ncbi:MAG TPA: HNH endonuclease [Blastocatellia bacterium]|nr:HNH endonuclease [Blastocatellia bacterium]